MIISELKLTLPPDTKSLIRSIEKTTRKIINTQLSLVFNKTCIQENLLPAYINIYIYIYIFIYIQQLAHLKLLDEIDVFS